MPLPKVGQPSHNSSIYGVVQFLYNLRAIDALAFISLWTLAWDIRFYGDNCFNAL